MVEIKAATQKSKQVTETHRSHQAFQKKKKKIHIPDLMGIYFIFYFFLKDQVCILLLCNPLND